MLVRIWRYIKCYFKINKLFQRLLRLRNDEANQKKIDFDMFPIFMVFLVSMLTVFEYDLSLVNLFINIKTSFLAHISKNIKLVFRYMLNLFRHFCLKQNLHEIGVLSVSGKWRWISWKKNQPRLPPYPRSHHKLLHHGA